MYLAGNYGDSDNSSASPGGGVLKRCELLTSIREFCQEFCQELRDNVLKMAYLLALNKNIFNIWFPPSAPSKEKAPVLGLFCRVIIASRMPFAIKRVGASNVDL